MPKGRVEAFSDGVIAIIITIMVLELKPPHGRSLADLAPIYPKLLAYVLSFIYVGIYWSNHHHLFQAVKHVSGMTLWANLHLLFWLSLVPFTTDWMGESHFAASPVAAYGFVMFMCGVAWEIERRILLRAHDSGSPLHKALRRGVKERSSVALYVVAIALAFVFPIVACAIYALVAALWFIPDRRVERAIHQGN